MTASLTIDGQTIRLTPRVALMATVLAKHARTIEPLGVGKISFAVSRGKLVLTIEQSAEMIREDAT